MKIQDLTCNANVATLARLLTIASTETTRFYLNGVHVRARRNTPGILLEATNGHLAAIENDENGTTNADGSMSLVINREAIADMVRIAALYAKEHRSTCELEDLRVDVRHAAFTLIFKDSPVSTQSYSHTAGAFIECSFPDVERVIPRIDDERGPGAAGAFNADYITRLALSARKPSARSKKGNGGTWGVSFMLWQHDAESPAIMRVEGAPKWFGVIMPRSATIDAARPQWFL